MSGITTYDRTTRVITTNAVGPRGPRGDELEPADVAEAVDEWLAENPPIPNDGLPGQVLTETGDGPAWQTPASDAGGTVRAVNGAEPDVAGNVTITAAAIGAATSTQGGKADTAVQPGDLAQVATSGEYLDLEGLPTLGTAAAAETTDFDPAGAAAEVEDTLTTAIGLGLSAKLDADARGAAGGVAALDDDGIVPVEQLPGLTITEDPENEGLFLIDYDTGDDD